MILSVSLVPPTFAFRNPDESVETPSPEPSRQAHETHADSNAAESFLKHPHPTTQPPKGWHTEQLRGELPGLPRTEDEVVKAVEQFLQVHLNQLGGVQLEQLKRSHVATVPAVGTRPAMVTVQFVQHYDGLEVEGSYVHLSVKLLPGRTVVVSGKAHLYPQLVLPPSTGNLSDEEAGIKTAEALALDPSQATVSNIHRKAKFLHGRWRRLKEVHVNGSDLKGLVDEATGDTWVEDDRIYATITGHVRGRGVLFNPSELTTNHKPLDVLDLKNLAVTASNGRRNYTDATGYYTLPTTTLSTTVNAILEGRWAKVSAILGPDLSFSGTAKPPTPLDILFNPFNSTDTPHTVEWNTAQVNGYYHTDFIHDWVQARLPKLSLPALDIALPVKVNLLATCNAFYNPSNPSINFFRADSRCLNTAMDTIIYHEYGHFVDDMAGGILNRGLSEGWGDVLATFASQQPLIGEGVFVGDTEAAVRSADNTYQYPPAGWPEEVHRLGQAWSGFGWVLRNSFMASYGTATGAAMAENLIIPTILANSSDIPDAVADALTLDDEDGDLSNGTPHLTDIMHAASTHRIPVPPFVNLRAPGPAETIPLAAGEVTIQGTATGPGFQQYQLFHGFGIAPADWQSFSPPGSSTAVVDGNLGTWSLSGLEEGLHIVRLVVTLRDQLQTEDQVLVELLHDVPTPILPAAVIFSAPVLSDSRLVWVDGRNSTAQLYWADLATAQGVAPIEHQIIRTTRKEPFGPVMSGNRIAWVEYQGKDPVTGFPTQGNIYSCVLNPQTGDCPEENVATGTSEQISPAVSRDRIVYLDDRNKFFQVYLYDPHASVKTRAITTNLGNHFSPHIAGDLIVWDEFRDDAEHIYLYNLAEPPTKAEHLITSVSGFNSFLSNVVIVGNRIAWTQVDLKDDTHPTLTTIFSCQYDVPTGACPIEEVAASSEVLRGNLALSTTQLVWQDNRNKNWDIYRYDLAGHTEHIVTVNPLPQGLPTVAGDRIVWIDQRNGDNDFYTVALTSNHPPVFTPVSNHVALLGLPTTITLSASDQDKDDQLTYAAVTLPPGANFNVATHTFNWTPSMSQAGVYPATFRVTDRAGLTDTLTVTITAKSLTISGTIQAATTSRAPAFPVRLGQSFRMLEKAYFRTVTDVPSGNYVFTPVQEAKKLQQAIMKCQTAGVCALVQVGVYPSLVGWRFHDMHHPTLNHAVVTIDPANPTDVTGVDFMADPR